jgi:hypothetical protein
MSNDVWATEPKTELDAREALIVAHAHLIGGIDQHKLAAIYAVNMGRVNEAITVLREAAENHRDIHRKRARALRRSKTTGTETPSEPVHPDVDNELET